MRFYGFTVLWFYGYAVLRRFVKADCDFRKTE